MTEVTQQTEGRPWYKEPWGWFVFAPLFIVVFICSITVSIAFIYSDDVVKDEYVKKGKAYDKDFSPEKRAKDMGISAQVEFDFSRSRVKVYVNALSDAPFADVQLELLILHPLKENKDIQIILSPLKAKHYIGVDIPAVTDRRYVQLQARKRNSEEVVWKVKQEVDFSQIQSFVIH